MRKSTLAALLVVATGVTAAQAPANPAPTRASAEQQTQKTWLCHRASSGWVAIRPTTRAHLRGHLRHGDVVATGATNRQQARTFCGALPTPTRGGTALTGNLTGTAGTGLATLRLRANVVCFQFSALPAGFTFTAAHIHRGTATGPIIVPLTSSGQTAGCVKASPQLVREILANPAGFVVNLHNAGGTVVLSAQLAAA